MSEEEIRAAVESVLSSLGIEVPTVKEKGLIMKNLMPLVKGKADGKLVNQVVEGFSKNKASKTGEDTYILPCFCFKDYSSTVMTETGQLSWAVMAPCLASLGTGLWWTAAMPSSAMQKTSGQSSTQRPQEIQPSQLI